jgi:hypothetical protein
MTIKYLSGRRIQGLSTDTKPTSNIQAGSVFDELDTHKSYVWHNSAWVQLT